MMKMKRCGAVVPAMLLAGSLSLAAAAGDTKEGKKADVLFLGAHVHETAPGKPNKYELRSIMPDAHLQDKLKEWGCGWTADFFSTKLTLEYLKQFNAVAMLDFPIIEKHVMVKDEVRKAEELLKEYVREGGGLLLTGSAEYSMWGMERNTEELNRFLKDLDAEVLKEQVAEKNPQLRLPRQNPSSPSELAWTGNVTKHPVTEGVEGFIYPTGYAWCYYTRPVKVGQDWQVLMKGSPTSYSFSCALGTGKEKDTEKEATFKSEAPMLAVREYGKGRIILWPEMPSVTVIDGYHPFWGGGLIMNPKKGELPSSGETLLRNMLNWLAAPSAGQFGGYVAKPAEEEKDPGLHPIDWDKIHYADDHKEYPNLFKGLIGLKSTLSTGASSPEEMLTAAKEAGYDFAAFSEDLDKLTEEKLAALNRLCAGSSGKDFQAYPGFIYKDASGNSWQVFGKELPWPKDDWWHDREKKTIVKNNMIFRGYQFCPVIMVHPNKNPESPFFQGNFKGIAVYTYEGGKLLDDATEVYKKLQADNFALFPIVVNVVRSADEVRKAAGAGIPQSYVPWFEAPDIIAAYSGNFISHNGHYYFQRPQFISTGPLFDAYRVDNFGSADLAIPSCERLRMFLSLRSDNGLKEVVILDKGKLWRRFVLNGEKRWAIHLDGFHDKNHDFIAIATDMKGGAAMSADRWTCIQDLNMPRCTDNLNTYTSGKYQAQKLFAVRGIENYVDRQAGNFSYFPSFEGLKEIVRPAVEQNLDMVSRFGYVKTDVMDCHYPETATPNWNCNDQPESAQACETVRRRATVTLFTPWADGTAAYIVESRMDFLKEVTLPSQEISVFAGNWVGFADTFALARKNGTMFCGSLKPWSQSSSYRESLKDAFYVADIGAQGGSRAIVPFGGDLSYVGIGQGKESAAKYYLGIRLNPGKTAMKKGDSVICKYLSVWTQMQPPPDNVFIEDVVSKMGLRDGKTAYETRPERGFVLEKAFVLRLQAEDYGFRGKITQAALPMRLPVFIEGLNGRWPAGIWYKGKNELFIPEWTMDREHNRYAEKKKTSFTDPIFRFGALDGRGMLQVDTEIGDKDVYVGNLLTCENPEVFLELDDWRPGKVRITANNPTDFPVKVTIRPGPGFDLLGNFAKAVTIPAGGIATVDNPELTLADH